MHVFTMHVLQCVLIRGQAGPLSGLIKWPHCEKKNSMFSTRPHGLYKSIIPSHICIKLLPRTSLIWSNDCGSYRSTNILRSPDLSNLGMIILRDVSFELCIKVMEQTIQNPWSS